MDCDNGNRFEKLLAYVQSHANGKYTLFYEREKRIDSVFDSVYESDNGFEPDEDEYEEYNCISFKNISNGILFEVNYRQMPSKAICDGETIY